MKNILDQFISRLDEPEGIGDLEDRAKEFV